MGNIQARLWLNIACYFTYILAIMFRTLKLYFELSHKLILKKEKLNG